MRGPVGRLGAGELATTAGRFLVRYRPFLVTVLAIVLVAVFLPGRERPTGSDIASGGPVAQGPLIEDATPAPERATTADRRTAGAGGPSATAGPAAVSAPGLPPAGAKLVANCDPATKRIRIPSFGAPPCVAAFPGTNAGATSQGVTKDTITLAVYDAQDDAATEAILTAAGGNDTPEQTRAQQRDWVEFYQSHFNTWGRKVKLVFVDGSGAPTDDAAGKADAIKVATQIKAFASIGSPNNTYVDELVARGVLCFCTVSLPNSFYRKWTPYVWSTLPSAEQIYAHVAEYVGKRLAGRNAVHAGDPAFQGQQRKIGLIQYETRDFAYRSAAGFFKQELKRYGVELATTAFYNGFPDIAANQTQAGPVIQRLKAAGVTTVVFGGDPFGPIFFAAEAARQLYRPEWIVTGSALTDTAFFARLYDQEQWSHAFGLTQLTARVPETLSDAYSLLRWHFGRAPSAPAGYAVLRAPFDLFFLGVHMAGPSLTPQTFRTGMFALPVTGAGHVTVPTQSFGGKLWPYEDYTSFDDTAEIWWDPAARGPDEIGNNGQGLYRYVAGGKRYLPGKHPRTPVKPFSPGGSVTIYSGYPPGDKPPQYPRPK